MWFKMVMIVLKGRKEIDYNFIVLFCYRIKLFFFKILIYDLEV